VSPEGLDDVGGGRGPGQAGLPGEGDGRAAHVRHLGPGGRAGDQVGVGGSDGLNRDSEFYNGGHGRRRSVTSSNRLKYIDLHLFK